MPKTKKKLQNYYACVTIETIIYFQAEDDKNASDVAEEIAGDLEIDISPLAPKKYQSTEIETDGYEVTEIESHE